MINLLLTLYKLMLRLYPSRFYAAFGSEMSDVLAEKLYDAADNWALLAVFSRELRHWPSLLLREHWAAQQTAFNFPVYEKLSWRGTAVATLPYLFMALLFGLTAILSGINLDTILFIGLFAIMLFVAWWQRWPAWSASWLGFIAFMLLYAFSPQFLFQTDYAWNTVPRLLQMIATEIVPSILLFGLFYWLVGRWPLAGSIALLFPIGFTGLLSMEFVPENVTTLIFMFTWGWLAVVSVLMVRWGNGRWHGWCLILAGLVIGLLSSFAGEFWVSFPGGFIPADGGSLAGLLESFLSDFVPTLLPLVAILLLHLLRRQVVGSNGRSNLRQYHFLFWGIVSIILACQIAQRLFLPDDLTVFRAGAGVVSTVVFLLGILGIILGIKSLRRIQPGWLLLTLLVIFPFLYQAEAISILLGELPFLGLSNQFVLYETVRLGGRAVGLIWLGLAAWLLGRTFHPLSEKVVGKTMPNPAS